MDERIVKYFSNELTSEEREALLKEIRSDESLERDFVEYKNSSAVISLYPLPSDKEEGERRYRDFEDDRSDRKGRILLLEILKYAAVVIFSFFTAYLLLDLRGGGEEESASNTVSVPAGQRVSLVLSDGTKVWLNSRSVLTYPSVFSRKERNVKLTGEAYFEVSKNKKKPFIVSTRSFDVKVLGTVFDLCTYKEFGESSLSLLKGRVAVKFKKAGLPEYILSPDHKLSYKNGKVKISVFSEDSFIWKEGIYSFKQAPLSEIMKELAVYYNAKIVIGNPRLMSSVYTGKFRQNSSLDEILGIIRKIQKFDIQKKGDTYILK